MEQKTFLRTFIISLLAFISLYVAIVEGLNPQLTGFLNLRYFEKWTTNIEYMKFQNIGRVEDVETVVLGSSTSEAYHASDIDKIFNTKTYTLSLGGADTPTRYVFFKKAIEEFSNLKRIIYIADFFEFNKEEAKPAVAFNKEMGASLPSFAKPNGIDFIKYYLNHQLLEDAFNILKRKKKNKQIILGDDGSASRSMVISSIQAKNGLRALITKEQKEKLTEYIVENYVTYSRSVLNDFEELNQVILSLYEEMISMAQEKKIEIIFILSPYHNDFRNRLMEIENIPKHYESWQELFSKYSEKIGVIVVNPTESFIATEPLSGAWRDGIHYGREAAFSFVEEAKSEEDGQTH